MNPRKILEAWIRDPDPGLLGPSALRLARRVPPVRQALGDVLLDPLLRALAGLDRPPEETELDRAVLAAVAAVDGGEQIAGAADLEARAHGDLCWWVPAAWVHGQCEPARRTSGLRSLAVEGEPFVFPGELDPLTVDVLAVGEFALSSLHRERIRLSTRLAGEALRADLACVGLWLWPVIRWLDPALIGRHFGRAPGALPPGALGLLAAYKWWSGQPLDGLLDGASQQDHLLYALARVGDQSG